MQYVYIKLTQAQHNQLKKAMALIISAHHDNALLDKQLAQYKKSRGHNESAKLSFRDSRKHTSRANRLANLQKKIKHDGVTINSNVED